MGQKFTNNSYSNISLFFQIYLYCIQYKWIASIQATLTQSIFYQLFSSFSIATIVVHIFKYCMPQILHTNLFLLRNTIEFPQRIAWDLLNLIIKVFLSHCTIFYERKQKSSSWKYRETILMKFLRIWTICVVTKGFFHYQITKCYQMKMNEYQISQTHQMNRIREKYDILRFK